jgi:hypothetical protein
MWLRLMMMMMMMMLVKCPVLLSRTLMLPDCCQLLRRSSYAARLLL